MSTSAGPAPRFDHFAPPYSGADGNPSFSRALPGMQVAIDATSLSSFKTCPRLYYYTHVMGYQTRVESVHLSFGIWLHGGHERYHYARFLGNSHDESLDIALQWVLEQTWDRALQRPWSSIDPAKNRFTLVRTLIDYLDRWEHDTLVTVKLANGKPAVELSFAFDSGLRVQSTGEVIQFCGYMDRVATLNDAPYAVDPKTSKHTLSPSWWAQWSPNCQFSMYSLAGRVAFGVPLKGIIVDGIQVAATFNRFERQPVLRDEDQLREWHRDTGLTLRAMETCAQQQYWPQNDTACDKYGGCPFRGICSKSPSARGQWLASEFKQRQWNPLAKRGDV